MAELDRARRRLGAGLARRRIDEDECASLDGGAVRRDLVDADECQRSEFSRLDVELRDAHEVAELHDVASGDGFRGGVVDGLAALNVTCFHLSEPFFLEVGVWGGVDRGNPDAAPPARLGRGARRLDHAAMILLADADVEEHAEPDAEDVEVQVAALDGRGALALEVADLEGVHDARLAEEVPRRLGGAGVLRVREVRARDDLEVLVGEDVDRRTHHVVRAAGHDEGRALRQLRSEELERGRHEQDARLDVDRLAVRVHLVGEELDRLLERIRREGRVRARKEVLVVAAEERLAVHARRVLQETLEEELVHETGGAVAHRRRHLEERAEIVVDDHLAREAELLRVGLELVLRRLLGECAVLDLAVRADGLQVADVGEAEAVVLLEVREVARRAELRGDDGLRLIRLHELLVRDVREDAGERDGREGRLDRLVVERAGDAHPLDPHALAEDAGERHVGVLHRRLHDLLAHVLHELVAADSGA